MHAKPQAALRDGATKVVKARVVDGVSYTKPNKPPNQKGRSSAFAPELQSTAIGVRP